MNLLQRLQHTLRTFLEDIFGEGDEPGGILAAPMPDEFLEIMLSQAQRDVDGLQLELANARQHQQNIQQQKREAQEQAAALNEAVDEALRSEQEDLARSRLAQLQQLERSSSELDQLEQAWSQQIELLEEAVREQCSRLENTRRKAQALIDHERSIETTMKLVEMNHALNRQVTALQSELSERQEQLARREDRLAARREVEQHGKS